MFIYAYILYIILLYIILLYYYILYYTLLLLRSILIFSSPLPIFLLFCSILPILFLPHLSLPLLSLSFLLFRSISSSSSPLFPHPLLFFLLLQSQSIFCSVLPPLLLSLPNNFILYVSVLTYTYLYSRLIQLLTPHVLSEWMVEVCGAYLCGVRFMF